MNKNEKLTLTEGNFSGEEAREFLTNIFLTHLNFYNLENWSSQIRDGKNHENAQLNIPTLKIEIEKLHKILSEAKANNNRMVVSSVINISILNNQDLTK